MANSAEVEMSGEIVNNRTKETVKELVGAAPQPDVQAQPGEMAEVEYSKGLTVNMGNFNSARVHIALRLPVRPEPKAIRARLDWAKAWVEKELEAELDRLTKAPAGQTKR